MYTEYKLKSMALDLAAPSGQQCTMGFLNEESLRMIVDAPTNAYSSRSFSFPGIPPMAMSMSMPLSQSGPLRKMVIAARFNATIPVGWPELQIIRYNVSNGTFYVAFSTKATEPTPTEYLNVFEYNLTAVNFSIEAGDVLNISWRGNEQEPDQIRFSLAYYNCKIPSTWTPMVSIIVGDNASESDTDLNCEEDYTDAPTTSTKTENINPTTVEDAERPASGTISTKASILTEKSNADDLGAKLTTTDIATICGVTIFSLLLTILIILVVTCMVVVRRRRKSASANTANSIGINRYVNEAQPFHDTAGKIVLALIFNFLYYVFSRECEGASLRK